MGLAAEDQIASRVATKALENRGKDIFLLSNNRREDGRRPPPSARAGSQGSDTGQRGVGKIGGNASRNRATFPPDPNSLRAAPTAGVRAPSGTCRPTRIPEERF